MQKTVSFAGLIREMNQQLVNTDRAHARYLGADRLGGKTTRSQNEASPHGTSCLLVDRLTKKRFETLWYVRFQNM